MRTDKRSDFSDYDCASLCVSFFLDGLKSAIPPVLLHSIRKYVEEFKCSGNTLEKARAYKSLLRLLRRARFVLCPIGILYVEKAVLSGDCNGRLFNDEDNVINQLVNNKIAIFGWIRPSNLEIDVPNAYIAEVREYAEALRRVDTPSEKAGCIVKVCRAILHFGGGRAGSGSFLPVLIYTIVRFGMADVYLSVRFVEKFLPVPIGGCSDSCNHLGQGFNNAFERRSLCGCARWVAKFQTMEINFYLISFEAAISFIMKMEYKSIVASRKEYDENVLKRVGMIDSSPAVGRKPESRKTNLIGKIMGGASNLIEKLLRGNTKSA